MKKRILAPALAPVLAIAISGAAITPAYAAGSDTIAMPNFSALIGLLLPAVQKVREAASR